MTLPRLAIGQTRMHWSIEGNLSEMLSAMRLAQREGAQACVFPELALPGFHREITALARRELIEPAIEALQAECARLSMAIAFGAPTFSEAGIRNSCFFLSSSGERSGLVHKNGLTAPEASFFAHGTDRPVSLFCGLRTSAILCREIEDEGPVCSQLMDQDAQLLLWPGQMRPDPDKPPSDPPEHVVQAQALAARLGAYVVQANWPNALNRPGESADTGHSAVIGPTGSLLFRAPKAQPGVAVFTLGAREFSWFASEG
jgi:predicted amidohydrolase